MVVNLEQTLYFQAGHSPTVNTLLQQDADVISVNSNRQTALHAACQRPGNTEVWLHSI